MRVFGSTCLPCHSARLLGSITIIATVGLASLGCMAGPGGGQYGDGHANGSSSTAGGDEAFTGNPLGGLFSHARGGGVDQQSDIAKAALKDPFPSAAEALGN